MIKDATYWIEKLGLVKHPEGGYYRETYRSDEAVERSALPGRFSGPRPFSTAIYFLLSGDDISAFHRIKSDEVWHFYSGAPLTIHVIEQNGNYSPIQLGCSPVHEEYFQAVIKAGSWFGAALNEPRSYALVGCTVAPGFDFSDFEMGAREKLCRLYPAHRTIIEKLTLP